MAALGALISKEKDEILSLLTRKQSQLNGQCQEEILI